MIARFILKVLNIVVSMQKKIKNQCGTPDFLILGYLFELMFRYFIEDKKKILIPLYQNFQN